MNIGFEIDEMISTPVRVLTDANDVRVQKVIVDARETLQKIKAAGHQVILYTRRDVSTGIETENWLNRNGIPYDKIVFNRPHAMMMYFAPDVREFGDWATTKAELYKNGVIKKDEKVEDTGTAKSGRAAGNKPERRKTKKKVEDKSGGAGNAKPEKKSGVQVLK